MAFFLSKRILITDFLRSQYSPQHIVKKTNNLLGHGQHNAPVMTV